MSKFGTKRDAAAAAVESNKENEKKAKVEEEEEEEEEDVESGVSEDEYLSPEEEDKEHPDYAERDDTAGAKLSNEYKYIRREVHDGKDRSFEKIAEDTDNEFWTAITIRQYYEEGCQQAEERRSQHVESLRRCVRMANRDKSNSALSKLVLKRTIGHFHFAIARLERHNDRTKTVLARNANPAARAEEEENE